LAQQQKHFLTLHLLLAGGVLVELANNGILHSMLASACSSTLDFLLAIVSGMFLFETAAFLCVVWRFQPKEGHGTEQLLLVLA
jgi:hypothetical protein